MKFLRTNVLCGSALSLIAMALAGCGGGSGNSDAPDVESYPDGPVSMIVWGTPGSGTDILGRSIATSLEGPTGQSVQVENLPVGGGVQAANELMKRPADGKTALVVTTSLIALVARDQVEMPRIVSTAVQGQSYFVVKPKSSFGTLKEALAYAKDNPGDLKIGGSQVGSQAHQLTKELADDAGVEITYVPYEGVSDAVTAVLGGKVDMAIGSNAAPQVISGELKALGVDTPERRKLTPDVPTLAELGYEVKASLWRGVAVHPDTDEAIVDKLYEFLKDGFASEAFTKYLKTQGEERLDIPQDEVQEWAKDQIPPTKKYLKDIGLL